MYYMKQNRNKTVQIRLTEEQYIELLRKAKYVEGMSVSTYIRNVLFPPVHAKEKNIERTNLDW